MDLPHVRRGQLIKRVVFILFSLIIVFANSRYQISIALCPSRMAKGTQEVYSRVPFDVRFTQVIKIQVFHLFESR